MSFKVSITGCAIVLAVSMAGQAFAESPYEMNRSGGVDATGGNTDGSLSGYRSSRFDELASLTAPSLEEIKEDVESLRTEVNNNYTATQNLYDQVNTAQATADTAQSSANQAKASADSAYSRANDAYSRANAAYNLASSANGRASSAHSLASQNKIVATSKWRSGRVESTASASPATSCRAPSGTRYLSRVWMDSGYHGRGGSDNYFWLCFYTR